MVVNRFYLCVVLFSLLFVIFSCSSEKNKDELSRSVFRYNESSGITSLDPAYAKDQANIWACNQLFNGLVQLDDDLKIKPCIAKSWFVSDDGLTYTFFLRDDVRFHSHQQFMKKKGRKVTAFDFEYSFKRIVDEKTASPGSWVFNNVRKNSDNEFSFIAINDTTFVINLQKTFPPFLGLLSMQYCSVVPREIVELYGKEFRKNPIGTGPFFYKMWKEGVKLIMLKNPKYFEIENEYRLPYLDAIAVTFIIDKQTAFLEFVKGNMDFLSGIDPSYKDELLTKYGQLNPKYKDKFTMTSQSYLNTEYLGFLMDEEIQLFNDNPTRIKLIRKAINYGFDRKKMIKYLRNNIGTPGVNGFVPKGLPSYDSSIVKGYYYDREKAMELLKHAGFENGNNLPEISLTTTSSYLDLCKFIQHQLSEIGLKINIDVNPPATLREIIAQSKVGFFRGSWIADYPDAENYLSLFYSKNFCPKGPNYTHFSNEKYDLLYEKAQIEVNDSLRYIYYREMDQIIIDEAPLVVLYYDQVLRFVQKNIHGIGSNPMNLLSLKRVKKGKWF